VAVFQSPKAKIRLAARIKAAAATYLYQRHPRHATRFVALTDRPPAGCTAPAARSPHQAPPPSLGFAAEQSCSRSGSDRALVCARQETRSRTRQVLRIRHGGRQRLSDQNHSVARPAGRDLQRAAAVNGTPRNYGTASHSITSSAWARSASVSRRMLALGRSLQVSCASASSHVCSWATPAWWWDYLELRCRCPLGGQPAPRSKVRECCKNDTE
jgi:hypothetical protein